MIVGRAKWHVVPLAPKTHDRASFSCGAPELDRYIREQASQDVKRDVARVYVAVAAGGTAVGGYYSLSAASFRREDLPAAQAKKLPHYPVPAALLGRLAVDASQRRQGLGRYLLMDAIERVHLASRALAVHAMIVDARDDLAATFYGRFGFLRFPTDGRRMFLSMATIRELVGEELQ